MTLVMQLGTSEYVADYDLEPLEAVIAAYAQFGRQDFNTWQYEEKYYDLLRVMQHSVSCGDFAATI